MKVNREDVEHVAVLARIELTEEEQETCSSEISSILEFFDRLKEVDTEGIPPTSHVLDLINALRPDVEKPSLEVDDALRNAPDRSGRFYRVPRIMD